MVNTTQLSNSAGDYSTLIRESFKKTNTGTASAISGQQMAACAILMRQDILIAQATKQSTVVALSMLQATQPGVKNEARALYLAELNKLYAVPSLKAKETKNKDVLATNKNQHNAEIGCIRRGLDLAIVIDRAGLNATNHWDVKANLFHVLPAMLMLPTDVTSGRLSNPQKLIPLDGKPAIIVRGDSTLTIYASVAQVGAIADAKAGRTKVKRGANETPSATDPSDMVKSLAVEKLETWSIDQLLSIAGKLLNQASAILGEGDKSNPTAYSDLTIDTRNALEAIVIFRDECKAEQAKRDAAAFNTSKKAA